MTKRELINALEAHPSLDSEVVHVTETGAPDEVGPANEITVLPSAYVRDGNAHIDCCAAPCVCVATALYGYYPYPTQPAPATPKPCTAFCKANGSCHACNYGKTPHAADPPKPGDKRPKIRCKGCKNVGHVNVTTVDRGEVTLLCKLCGKEARE